MRQSLIKSYETDASQIKGKATDVILPKTITEIQNIVKQENNITPRGGGTGLVGGAVPQDGIVVDLSKLNKIIKFDAQRKTIEVQTGIILGELNGFLSKHNLEFPVKPSSYEVCTIGGMIATDAVGSRAIKYGRTSKWVDSIEIINSEGELRKIGKAELSDYSALEGTTGIIVTAKLNLIELRQRTADLFAFNTLEEVLAVAKQLKTESDVSMIEVFSKQVSELLGLENKHHLLVEYESNQGKLKEREYHQKLSLRDKIYPILAKQGYTKIEDPKVLTDRFVKLAEWFEQHNIPYFGHLGFGIIHACFKETPEHEKLIEELMSIVRRLHGQISGEHGIGLEKKQFLDQTEKRIFMSVKKRCDPQNKFNPGKIL